MLLIRWVDNQNDLVVFKFGDELSVLKTHGAHLQFYLFKDLVSTSKSFKTREESARVLDGIFTALIEEGKYEEADKYFDTEEFLLKEVWEQE